MIHELSASDAAARIRARTLTSTALVEACLDRIDAREPEVGAWEHLDRDHALGAAREADRSEPRGPLHGVPIGVKDIIDTADMPTALGSKIHAGRRPQQDAACVAAARAAGAIVLGKTVTTEFAYFTPGKTRNPHDVRRTPGGSSSGSAAAVADDMVPLALGSQTAASVIRPASFCGVFGYKASFGALSLSGIRPFADSLDALGIFARSIADIALLRGVLIDGPGVSADVARIRPLPAPPRIGLCRTAQWMAAEPCARDALEASGEIFRRAGASLQDIELPPGFVALIDAQKTVMAYEAARNYAGEASRHPDLLSEAFRALLDMGARIGRESYDDAKRAIADAGAILPAAFGGCDVLVTTATIGEAPMADAGTGDPLMSRMWTALHLPALAVPVTKGPHGMPVGVQLIAMRGADALLLDVGSWAHQALLVDRHHQTK